MVTRSQQQDKVLRKFQVGLTGKLITSTDPSRLILEQDGRTQIDNFKSLKNIRYTDNGIRGISGMTKINTTALSSHPKIRAIHQFTKSQPVENHVLVQAYNSGETESKVFRNDTVIPNQGDFNATALHTDASGAGKGRFANGQLGRLLYNNGVETMVYGGDESRLSNFTIYDPNGTFLYDYTEKVQNTLSDSGNVATLKQVSGIGAETKLLLHCDGTDGSTTITDDSPTTPHTVTAVGNAQIDTAQKVFGTASLLGDGTGDWATIPDDADFDLSGGTWTYETWYRPASLAADIGLYAQAKSGVASDYMWIYIDTNGAVNLLIQETSAPVVSLATPNGVISADTWAHIRVVEDGNDFYIFINGIQKAYVSDTDRTEGALAYDSTVFIGAVHDGTSTTKSFNGHFDEVRLTDSVLSTTDFEVPASAYTAATTDVNIRIGNILPVEGFNFTISNANTSIGTMSVFYWSAVGAWTAVTNLTDNTVSGGIPFAQTGTVTFNSVETVARQSIIDGVLGYWIKIEITDADAATAISNVTVKEPFQRLQDFWDGELRIINSAQLFEDSKNKDNTVNVLEDDFIFDLTTAGDLSSYMEMDSLQTGTEYLTTGFPERQMGLQCKLIPNHTNTTSGTVIEVEYWSGAAWVSVGTISDGTIENNISFTKSGFITWNPIAENTEFRREVNKEDPLYYYRLSWSKTFSDNVLCYYIAGIPVQTQIENYSFALNAQGRTFLFANQSDKKNTGLASSVGTLNAFNGKDLGRFEFGDETSVKAAAEIFTKLTTGAVSDIFVAKNNASFLITGSNPTNWVVTEISDDTGCPAPYTLKASPVGLEFSPLQSKQVVIWQSENGIMMYDSNSIFPISDSISNFFDQTKDEAINPDKIGDSVGFWDNSNGAYEYHWLFASGNSTTLDKEWIFDLRRQKWFEADRTSGLRLQTGTNIVDINGNHYNYAAEDNGFVHRLENGTDFSGTSIPYEFEFGDIPLSGDINTETVIEWLQMIMVQKTSGTVTITHYGDAEDSGTTFTMSQIKPNYRITMPVERMGKTRFGSHVLHRLKFTISTNDQTIGFEPLYIGGFFSITRDKIKD